MQGILSRTPDRRRGWVVALALVLALGGVIAGWLIFSIAPREISMGDVQRIVYLHVAVAWCGLAGCVAMGLAAGAYLATSDSRWEHWSSAAGEVGWLCATLTLVTGSLWAHEAWNTWWTWEPRLTASLILWLAFAGRALVRASIEDDRRRARIAAVLSIVALADVPLVLLATRWFRGMHPVTPEMDPRMRIALLASVVCWTLLFAMLAVLRRNQLRVSERITLLEDSGSV